MAIKIKPYGNRLIVSPLPSEEETTDGGVLINDYQLEKAEVIEVSNYLKELFNVGDIVLYPKGSGIAKQYKNKSCLFVNAQEFPQGDVIGIITDDE